MVAKNLGKALTPSSFGKIQKNSNFFRETIPYLIFSSGTTVAQIVSNASPAVWSCWI